MKRRLRATLEPVFPKNMPMHISSGYTTLLGIKSFLNYSIYTTKKKKSRKIEIQWLTNCSILPSHHKSEGNYSMGKFVSICLSLLYHLVLVRISYLIRPVTAMPTSHSTERWLWMSEDSVLWAFRHQMEYVVLSAAEQKWTQYFPKLLFLLVCWRL